MGSVSYGSYGPVVVLSEGDGFRIGYYDDDDWEESGDQEKEGRRTTVVYFCEPPFLFGNEYELVRPERLRTVDTDALFRRRDELSQQLIHPGYLKPGLRKLSESALDERYRLLLEHSYVSGLLADRMFDARMHEGDRGGSRVFISHSSTDKATAISLSVDLANHGHAPWLDEWEIKAGESIPLKISDGLEQCDYVLVLMSKVAVESGWVEAEWTAKYWEEIGTRKVQVIPGLLEDCTIPMLLRSRKYADLREDYGDGLDQILTAIG